MFVDKHCLSRDPTRNFKDCEPKPNGLNKMVAFFENSVLHEKIQKVLELSMYYPRMLVEVRKKFEDQIKKRKQEAARLARGNAGSSASSASGTKRENPDDNAGDTKRVKKDSDA